MKRIAVKSNANPKILEGESQKLKEKLDLLKKQIEQKKKEKQMAKGGKLHQSKQSKQKTQSENGGTSNELVSLLTQIKLQQLVDKLKDRGIITCEQFEKISSEDIEKWKDIAVGYRIKLKKYLENGKKKLDESRKSFLSPSPSRQNLQRLDIEQIVRNRKQEQKYVALDRKSQLEIEVQQEELREQEQQVMINSLMQAFRMEKSDQLPIQPKEEFQWQECDSQDQNEKLEIIMYQNPVEKLKIMRPSTGVQLQQMIPDYKYCWSCLKKIQERDRVIYRSRDFCGQLCIEQYRGLSQIGEQNKIFDQIEQVNQKFDKYLKNRTNQSQLLVSKKEQKRKVKEKDNEQQIDLSVI